MRVRFRLQRQQFKQLHLLAKASSTSRDRLVGEAPALYLGPAPGHEIDLHLVIAPIVGTRFMPTGGVVVEVADGETVPVYSAEVGAVFGGAARGDFTGCGTGLRLFDAERLASGYRCTRRVTWRHAARVLADLAPSPADPPPFCSTTSWPNCSRLT